MASGSTFRFVGPRVTSSIQGKWVGVVDSAAATSASRVGLHFGEDRFPAHKGDVENSSFCYASGNETHARADGISAFTGFYVRTVAVVR